MALMAQIVDEGKPRELRWGFWHMACILGVIEKEEGDMNTVHTVKEFHTFTDPSDGEVLEFHPGTVLHVWRDR